MHTQPPTQTQSQFPAPRAARRLAWGLLALSVIVVAAGLSGIFVAVNLTHGVYNPPPHQLFNPIMTLTFGLVGALVAARHPRNPIGWLFGVVGFLSALSLLAVGGHGLAQAGVPLPTADLAIWLNRWVWIPPSILPLTLLLLWFPDGRPPSPRWRVVGWLVIGGLAAVTLAIMLHPDLGEELELGAPNPYGLAGSETSMEMLLYVGGGALLLGFIGSIVALVVAYRRSEGKRRHQMKWLVYACGLVVVGMVGQGVVPGFIADEHIAGEVGIILGSASTLTIVVATGFAMLRHRLYDVDLIINRTLVYSALTACVVALYVLVVGSLGLVIRAPDAPLLSVIATGVVAVAFQPLRQRLQRGVNRLTYGQRDEPYAVLSELGRQLEATLAPDDVLPAIAETLARALKLARVEVVVVDALGEQIGAASSGDERATDRALPLTYQGQTIGYLKWAAAPGDMAGPEQALLDDIAHQAGLAAHTVRLTAELQESRRQIVTAREEERRRLRRDLHDGFGPTLAALRVQAGVARRLIREKPAEAETLLDEFREEIRTVIDDVRRLAYELRPPALDDLGLVGALRTRAEQMTLDGASQPPMRITIDAPDQLPALPAAVEVAAYRIAQEALINAARHAHAGACTVKMNLDRELVLEIEDDGVGLPPENKAGVGVVSMLERAAELGGQCAVERRDVGGTRVRASLPLG